MLAYLGMLIALTNPLSRPKFSSLGITWQLRRICHVLKMQFDVNLLRNLMKFAACVVSVLNSHFPGALFHKKPTVLQEQIWSTTRQQTRSVRGEDFCSGHVQPA